MTHFDILSVLSTATTNEVKAAFRQKARESHPDKNMHRQVAATEEFKVIQPEAELESHAEANTPEDVNLEARWLACLSSHFQWPPCYFTEVGVCERSFYAMY